MTHCIDWGDMQLWQLKKTIHSSWLVAWASGAIVVGTAIVPAIKQTAFASVGWLVLASALFVLCLWKRYVALVPIIIIAGLLIGLWRGSVVSSQLRVFEHIVGRTVTISGNVIDDPNDGNHGDMDIRLGHLSVGAQPVPGKLWVSTIVNVKILRGDVVTVKGKLSDGFGSYPAAMNQASVRRIERPQPGDIARQLRDWFADKVRLAVNEPESSLGLGYLLGQKRALPSDLQQALVMTGLTHVVVASGYNLTILVRLTRRLFVKVSKYLATFSAAAMIIGFMAISGVSPSMSRAGLVSGLSLAAWYYGRKFHPLVLLPLAAALTTLLDPSYAWNDLGWQLSFAAFGGVMVLAPLLQAYFFDNKKPGTVRQILGETISANIATMPIIVLAFGQFSNVAILANLLVLPFVPLVMLFVFIAGIGSIVAPAFATTIGAPAQLLLDYTVWIIHYFASLGWAQTTVQISPFVVVGIYVGIVALCLYLWRATKLNLRDTNVVE